MVFSWFAPPCIEAIEAEVRGDCLTNLRRSAITDVVRAYVAPESLEEQWDLPVAWRAR